MTSIIRQIARTLYDYNPAFDQAGQKLPYESPEAAELADLALRQAQALLVAPDAALREEWGVQAHGRYDPDYTEVYGEGHVRSIIERFPRDQGVRRSVLQITTPWHVFTNSTASQEK